MLTHREKLGGTISQSFCEQFDDQNTVEFNVCGVQKCTQQNMALSNKIVCKGAG